MPLNRSNLYDGKAVSIPEGDIIKGDTLPEILNTIITPEILYVAFSDLHRLKYPSEFLFDSLIPLKEMGFNAIVYEMLPYKDTPYTLDEINMYWENHGWGGIISHIGNEIDVKTYSLNILNKCLELDIEIYGGDDKTTYSAKKVDRYTMNRDIANLIKKLIDNEKKVISFYGNEHNNTRIPSNVSIKTPHIGIPYYIQQHNIPFLIIKILKMHRMGTDVIEHLITPENKRKFIAIQTIPSVDFPHYFIRYPDITSGGGLGISMRLKYIKKYRKTKKSRKYRKRETKRK
jgi:hypothetical protein